MIYQIGKKHYEGKASVLHEAANERGKTVPDLLIIERKDDITAGDGEKRDSIKDKGVYTNRISNILFRLLESEGVKTHFVEELSPRETLIKRVTPLKLEIVVRNIATGSLCKRLPITEGTLLESPIVELYYKSDEHHDPLINYYHATTLGVVDDVDDLEELEWQALDANANLRDAFSGIGITLVDFKVEVGRTENDELIIIDEISPDTCRLWDTETGKPLDKDIFRKNDGKDATSAAYREVYERLTAAYPELS